LTQTIEHPVGPAGHGQQPPPPARGTPPAGRLTAFFLRWAARSPRWLAPVAILACFGGAAAYVLAREPVDGAGDVTTCVLKLTTGFDCPGCGGTRAFFYLVQGNIPAAARHHLVLVFAVPVLLYAYLTWAGNRIFRWRLPQVRPGPLAIGVFLISLGVYAVVRNLPWEPFTWFYV
jgi:hypothetical protein